MARVSRRITRKDLRQPDQFVTLTTRCVNYVREHKTPVALCLSLVVLAFLGLWGWELYRERQTRLAASPYSQGVALYHAREYREALERLAQAASFRWSPYSPLALLYQAHSHIALNEPDRAADLLRELLRRENKDPFLRQIAFIALGYAHEKAYRYAEAAQAFGDAEKLAAPFKAEALSGKARSSALNGDLQEALNLYRQYLSTYPGSENITQVELAIQELQAKVEPAKDAN